LISFCSPANLSPGIDRGFFLERDMATKAVKAISPHSDQKNVAAYINRASETGNLDAIAGSRFDSTRTCAKAIAQTDTLHDRKRLAWWKGSYEE
jgi:hypothetical protein